MDPTERRDPTPRSLARGSAAFNAVLWAVLAAFFFIVAYARADDTYGDADLTLIAGLRIIGSACGIVALLYSLRYLALLDHNAADPGDPGDPGDPEADTRGVAAHEEAGPQQ